MAGPSVAARPPSPGGRAGPGRRAATTRSELEEVALELFAERGFAATTVDDIAAAAGIARRTFFRYYPSKTDLVWGDFTGELDRLRARLMSTDPSVPVMEAIHREVIAFNRIELGQEAAHRRRMSLILGVPTLLANSTLHFAEWRAVLAEFAAERLGLGPGDLLPNVIAYSALGAALAGYEQWLKDDAADLAALLDDALGELAAGFRQREAPTSRTAPGLSARGSTVRRRRRRAPP